MRHPTFLCLAAALVAACTSTQTPKPVIVASPSDQAAILAALKTDQKTATFTLHYLKVSGPWAWADVTPLDAKGQPIAEGGPALLHHKKKGWKCLDLAKVPADPADPLGAEDASPGFVKNVAKTYPGVPPDIFPPPKH